jgi:hypothetical protein
MSLKRKITMPVILIGMSLSLGGCALPIGLEIASWTISGMSYLFTGKSVTDHAISTVAGKDCALHRPVIGDDFCQANDAGSVLSAAQVAETVPEDELVEQVFED